MHAVVRSARLGNPEPEGPTPCLQVDVEMRWEDIVLLEEEDEEEQVVITKMRKAQVQTRHLLRPRPSHHLSWPRQALWAL